MYEVQLDESCILEKFYTWKMEFQKKKKKPICLEEKNWGNRCKMKLRGRDKVRIQAVAMIRLIAASDSGLKKKKLCPMVSKMIEPTKPPSFSTCFVVLRSEKLDFQPRIWTQTYKVWNYKSQFHHLCNEGLNFTGWDLNWIRHHTRHILHGALDLCKGTINMICSMYKCASYTGMYN